MRNRWFFYKTDDNHNKIYFRSETDKNWSRTGRTKDLLGPMWGFIKISEEELALML